MPKEGPRSPVPPVAVTAFAAVLILIGGVIWFRPYLAHKHLAVTGVPAPRAKFTSHEFPVPAHQRACMDLVTIAPNTRVALFQLRPAESTSRGDPPVELVLTASGYRGVAQVPAGYLGEGGTGAESVQIPITPRPTRALIGSACFTNRGSSTVLLEGTTSVLRETETTGPGSVSRSAMTIGGRPVAGDIALKFLDSGRHSLLERLGEVFGHVSVLTDRLLPVWLVWLLAVLVAFGVPVGVLAALYLALRDDEATAAN